MLFADDNLQLSRARARTIILVYTMEEARVEYWSKFIDSVLVFIAIIIIIIHRQI